MDGPAGQIRLALPSAGLGPDSGPGRAGEAPAWEAASLAGRLVEVVAPRVLAARGGPSFGAALTAASSLIWKAQQQGEVTAWIQAGPTSFFPPDFAAGGIDLDALVVVRLAGAAAAARAADKLLRSGGFGLVVLDLGAGARLAPALASRLLGLALQHRAAVVFLSGRAAGGGDAGSLSPLVSLRVTAEARRTATSRFLCCIRAVKDKRRAPGWIVEESFRGPPGLR